MTTPARILLVEDEPGVVLIVANLLCAEGHVIKTAADGPTGLALATGEIFALLILDVMLPRLGGFELCHAMREQGFDGAVLMLTAQGEVTAGISRSSRRARWTYTSPGCGKNWRITHNRPGTS